MSRQLAAYLDIDVWNFNQHFIQKPKDKIFKMKCFAEDYECEEFIKDIKSFKILSNNGFKFIFMPEG